MGDARKYYGSDLRDVGGPKPIDRRAVIDRVEEGKFGKLNLLFADNTAVSLNATNSRALVKAFGPETDHWPGRAARAEQGRDRVPGQAAAGNFGHADRASAVGRKRRRPHPQAHGAAWRAARDMDDDIPF